MNNNLIAISIGDIDGIGIEILINLWKKKIVNKFVLFTNKRIFKNYLIKNKNKLNFNVVNLSYDKIEFLNSKFNIFDIDTKNKIDNTYKSIIISYRLCKKNIFSGLITLPLNKELIIKNIDKNFIGQTELLEKIDKQNTSNMVFIYKRLIISPLTTHIKINKITKILSKKDYIFNKIKSINKCLKNDFKINNPKILISGINPHAGEKGKISNDENKILIPEINKIKKQNINIQGPISADAMLTTKNINKYDCFLFVFHDQALIPFKYISKFSGVNFTANLNIIRTSPDHGTAYDLVGKNKAILHSLVNCFNLIKKVNKNRNKFIK